ncbi:MAG TPA: hypothetical protein DIU35_05855 [Candidatus Latescibacteria bacterium]|nr:hypothetical protein [Candidatus Latescibacterota bacterium]|tara:strand:- start:3359 stop:3637 length:279 start_codon:yes stop_codon:yes gene_type:complete
MPARTKYGQSITGDLSVTGNLDASGFTGNGDLIVFERLFVQERSSNPDDPPEGMAVMWMSDGTGDGDDGDILMKVTAGGSTKTATLIDFSAV